MTENEQLISRWRLNDTFVDLIKSKSKLDYNLYLFHTNRQPLKLLLLLSSKLRNHVIFFIGFYP